MEIDEPIIIIEDDADDQEVIKLLCDDIGICNSLVFFSNGKEALNYLRSSGKKPFLILCDINMPHIDGLALREKINKDDALRKKSIPFIFFSTAATEVQIAKAYDMTVQGFFLKENTLKETAETLDMIFKYWRKCKHPK